ncbi:MAG: tRNA (adenosine(37)-N6)-dimethylallyltransferase MiaA [Chloroflexi bacterium]|nr:tRNA (adenosine(37)-N6)-dimethylallyltransferase MiaA [Chloroflexota bacterium]
MAAPRVLFIVGPTASGKTAASLELSAHARIEIVNSDSRQVYRDMSIGTGKPTSAELASVPHHLIDVATPDEGYNLTRFLSEARAAIADIASRDTVPVVVGGTGQYVWGLVEGWRAPAVPPNPELRAELAEEARRSSPEALHGRLRAVDVKAADTIDPRNVRRVIRALEVWYETGAAFSRQRRKSPPGFEPVLLGIAPERAALRQRADNRVDAMLNNGWPEEVRQLLDAGYSPDLPSFSSVGYREVASYMNGELTVEEPAERLKKATHRLIRRQAAWFKAGDPRITWSPDATSLAASVLAMCFPSRSTP